MLLCGIATLPRDDHLLNAFVQRVFIPPPNKATGLFCLLFFVVSPAHLLIVVSSVNSASREMLIVLLSNFFKSISRRRLYPPTPIHNTFALASSMR
jgi:hypothetical protein